MEIILRVNLVILFSLQRSQLTPTRNLSCLSLEWNLTYQTVTLSKENQKKCWGKVFTFIQTKRMSWRQWESQIGSLNYAVDIVSLDDLHLRRLILEGISLFSTRDRDQIVLFPWCLRYLHWWWLLGDCLHSVIPLVLWNPSLTVMTDASDGGWGFQTSEGNQEFGRWTKQWSKKDINIWDLQTIKIALKNIPGVINKTIHMLSDNSIQCFNCKDSSWARALLWAS